MRRLQPILCLPVCYVLILSGCTDSSNDARLISEIRRIASNDYQWHDLDLTAVYGSDIPRTNDLIDDLRGVGFQPTFADEPIGDLRYAKCGEYHLPVERHGILLRRDASIFGERAYFAHLEQVDATCTVVGMSVARLQPVTP